MSESNLNPSENLLQLINRLVLEQHYDGISILLQDKRNCNLLKDICSDGINICKKYLTDECYENNITLYSCCEILLKAIAEHACQEEVLFELLEFAEITKSDNVFTSVLKALQICLLRQQKYRARSLEWSLNSIQNHVSNLSIPDILKTGFDDKQEKLLEEDDKVHRILTNYITISLFYEPILKDIIGKENNGSFIDTKVTRKNVLTCFLLQLLNRPLALLNLTDDKEHGYSYAFQCAKTLVRDLCLLFPDPLFFLGYVEKRVKWKPKYPEDGIYELTSKDIFLVEEKIPLVSLGIFYYLLFKEQLLPANSPKVYHPLYIFESCLYLIVELFNCKEPNLHHKAILLTTEVLNKMGSNSVLSDSLNLKVHANFCNSLIKIISYSDLERNRILGVQLLKKYILQFSDDGRYFLLKNLMKITTHNNLLGYIFIIFKNLVAEKLDAKPDQLIEYYRGTEFKNIMLNFICKLNDNIETDLMQYSDQVISSLNILRYFAIRDKDNKTGFWDFTDEIKTKYLQPLRKAVDLSRAHYKEEELRVRNNQDDINEFRVFQALSKEPTDLTKERKLSLLAGVSITFDLIESLLARVFECFNVFW